MIDNERLAAEFARQAAIASPSFREGEIARYLTERLRRLGADVYEDTAGEKIGGESGNLIAFFPARGKESDPLMLSVHMDTVQPAEGVRPLLRDGIFTSAGDTILGADDKAGIAEIIEALEVIRERDIPHGPLEVVVTVCEEVGLLGAKHLDYSRIQARRGLALDTSGVDLLIHRAPAANKMRFEISGREAHAGICPERGLSAIEIAAAGVAAMRLGRIDAETTANIGTIQGGQATNIVPKKVFLQGEARSHDAQKLDMQTQHMVSCLQEAASRRAREIDGELCDPEVKVEVMADYPAMAVPLDGAVVELVRKASQRLQRPLAIEAAGGGSDANIFNAHGIETIILGTGMTHVHTVDECVRVADMVRVAELLVEVIREA